MEKEIYNLLRPPFKSLRDLPGIKLLPYYTGPFEIFEQAMTNDEDWDLSTFLKIGEKYSRNTPILEIGCGNGRISVHLAENGLRVDCIDTSEDSLNRFHKKLKNNEALSSKIKVSKSDILTMPLEKRYELIILPNVTLHLFHSIELLETLMSSVKSRLTKDGYFAFSIFNDKAIPAMNNYCEDTFVTPYYDDRGRNQLMWRTLHSIPELNTLHISWFVQSDQDDQPGYLSAAIHKFWSWEEVYPQITKWGWKLVESFKDHVKGGGADGFGVITYVIQAV